MKILNLSPIAPGISMYVKGGTLQFLQDAYKEALAELTTSRIGSFYDATKAYVLNGCINSGSGSNYTISAGSLFFNGEVYLVPTTTFTISGSNVAVGSLDITQFTVDADPTDFTDGIQRNVHNIRQVKFGAALAGGGVVDFNNLINLAYKPVGAIGQTVEWLMPGTGSQNTKLATYFDPTSLQGIHPLTMGWIIDDGGRMAVGYLASDANFGSIGTTGGSVMHTNTIDEMATHRHGPGTSPKKGGTSGTGGFSAQDNPSGDYTATEWTATAGNGTPWNIMNPYKVKLKITRYA